MHIFKNNIDVHGDGKQKRAFVHIQNTVRALHNALYEIDPGTYNLVEEIYKFQK